MNTNKILSMATMLVLGTTMQVTMAQSMTSPYKIAIETSDVGSSGEFNIGDTGDTFDVPVISGRVIGNTTPYFVVVTMTGGAKFGGAGVELQCGYSGAGADPVAIGDVSGVALPDSPAAALSGAVASFKLQSAAGQGSLTSCQLAWDAGSGIHLSSGNNGNYGISITNRHMDNSDPVSATKAGSVVTFVQGLQASVSAGSVTIDVVSPSLSKSFLEGGSVLAAADVSQDRNVANLGVIRYVPATDVFTLAGTPIEVDSFLTDATLVVSGSPILGAVTATSGGTVTTGLIFLSSTATCSAAVGVATVVVLDNGEIASGNQVSFTVKATDFADVGGVGGTSGIKVCMLPNGITTLEKGIVSFSLTPVDTNGKPNLTVTDSTLTTVVKNGTSLKVLNLPPPDYTTDVAYVRFYNMGTVTGKIYGTLYSQGKTDGTNEGGGSPIGTPNTVLIDSLASGQVTVLSGPAIGAKFGVTTWPGRAWLQIESEVKGLRIQALVRSGGAGGTLTNMSDRVMYDGEVVKRNE